MLRKLQREDMNIVKTLQCDECWSAGKLSGYRIFAKCRICGSMLELKAYREDMISQWDEWISVEDGLPIPMQRVLIAPQAEVAVYHNEEWTALDGHCKYHCVTHWQYLPSLPDEQPCIECAMKGILSDIEEFGKAASEVAQRMAARFSGYSCCHCEAKG